MKCSYDFERPAIAVDTVVFGYQNAELYLLLIERGIEPYKGMWVLPGGFVRIDESLEAAALRELTEESGVENIYLEQLYSFGSLNRDPRERVISVAYFALVKAQNFRLQASTDAKDSKWFSVKKLPRLAFDHRQIVQVAKQRLQNKMLYEPLGFELLPENFTLTELQTLYEAIAERKLDKRNFRKKILSFGVLRESGKKLKNVAHRAPSLYQFDAQAFKKLQKNGVQFEI